ncbi:MAG: putative toxin-antitoxin system toxin component, PIN family [Gemmatimonadota bacterium]|nr:putative toxin-antitoxin system toxin component, PIN family [Gemmatimonadota bacterium]
MRVFLDTNVLVSAFGTRGICTDVLHVVLAEHQLVLGETVLEELGRKLGEKFRLPDEAIHEAQALLRREAAVISTASPIAIELRDPDDVQVLGEAVAGLSDILVTGDRDFLDVTDRLPIETVSPRGFWEKLQGAG